MKYGDNHRFPLEYLKTYSSQSAGYYEFPSDITPKPFESYQAFPKLSQEILVALFAGIGVRFVPEVSLYALKEKTAMQSFEDFCMTFGLEEDRINSIYLNKVIERLEKMDRLRQKRAFDSRAIYSALLHRDLEEADRLVEEMKEERDRVIALDNLNKDR